MKNILSAFLLVVSFSVFAQEKAVVSGKVSDKEMNNESLPFANVFVKGTTVGTTTDFDGNYTLYVSEGPATLVFSFVGYATIEVPMTFEAGQNYTISKVLGASEGITMDEVLVKAQVSREKETALLAEQKKAVVIKESIGAQRLAKVGVSNAAGATTKIAGVTKSESSSAVFIRGLGDRYLSTTLNGLPVPSDDVENKNINLNLFTTSIIKNVAVSKTYSATGYSDQASGTVNVVSKTYTKDFFKMSFSSGMNSNLFGTDFRVSENNSDLKFGFFNRNGPVAEGILGQGWDTHSKEVIPNFSMSFTGGKKFVLFDRDFNFFGTISHNASSEYQSGIFKSFRNNVVNNDFSDTEVFRVKSNTTAMINLGSRISDASKINLTSLFVNKASDNLFEAGRNGLGEVRDQRPPSPTTTDEYEDLGAFIRDQNVKQTSMFVNQILGDHRLSDTNKLKWALGYNVVSSEEPNRIRNQVTILTPSTDVEIINVGGFDQRKSFQTVEDAELNAYVQDEFDFSDYDVESIFKLNVGLNFRNKSRAFDSQFIGAKIVRPFIGFTVSSVDNLSDTFTQENLDRGVFKIAERSPDAYDANLVASAAYFDIVFSKDNFSGNFGLRYEFDQINVDWNVSNYVGRVGSTSREYHNLLPSLNLKYELNETNFLRFATSITTTLPEFKELSPFAYVAPNGRVSLGNPDLEKSDNYNFDLKWEFFPSEGELFSLTTFYKLIKNPINSAMTRGSTGYFTYGNTGEKSNIYGLELEGRFNIYDTNASKLSTNFNLTRMWFSQDLLPEFQYNGKVESALQGASDFILNSSLSFTTKSVGKSFTSTLSANFSSDKIAVLGSPEDFDNSLQNYNNEIIEEGFWNVDFVLSQELSERLKIKFIGRNLLNPDINQSQYVRYVINTPETKEIVRSYKKGVQLSLGLSYSF